MFDNLKKLFRKKDFTSRIEWTDEYKQTVKECLDKFILRGKDISHKQTLLLMETGEESSPEILELQKNYMKDIESNDLFKEVLNEAWERVYAQFAREEMQCEFNNRWGKEDKRVLKKKSRKINNLINKGHAKEAADLFCNSTSSMTLCVILKSLLKREFDLMWFSVEELAPQSSNSQLQIIG